ncbi:hypothetical protein CV103_12605 [Sphingomonas fennica]|uniref:Uncharacterized protein n=2 Tax=Edaphosphingomonas TaxID=3423724 RepID=A0A2T4HWE0_9SPHN|nr:hypothetical protein [Sphingomonas sp.]PTD20007.1 hypothetical protein CV103_12605 [Sphingomonas fennica]
MKRMEGSAMPGSDDLEWTDTDLDLMQSMDAAGMAPDVIARRLGRSEAAIRDHLPIVRARTGAVPYPGESPRRPGQDWQGPDEEGDVPLPDGRRADDPAAWVHIDPPERD